MIKKKKKKKKTRPKRFLLFLLIFFLFFKLAITLVARKVGHKWNSLAAEAGWCLLSLVKPLQDLQTFLSHAVKTKKQKNKKPIRKREDSPVALKTCNNTWLPPVFRIYLNKGFFISKCGIVFRAYAAKTESRFQFCGQNNHDIIYKKS